MQRGNAKVLWTSSADIEKGLEEREGEVGGGKRRVELMGCGVPKATSSELLLGFWGE